MAKFAYPNINSVDIDEDVIIKHVKENYSPHEVYSEGELEEWAESNGFVKEETDG